MRKIASYISTFISAHPRWAMAAAVLLISGLYLPALGHQTTHQDFEKHCPICAMLSLVFLFLPVALTLLLVRRTVSCASTAATPDLLSGTAACAPARAPPRLR